MRKTALILVIAVLMTTIFCIQISAGKDLSIFLNGQKLDPTPEYAFKAGRTMVALNSGLFEKLGAVVRHDESEGKVWVEGPYSTVELTLNEKKAYIHRKYDFSGIPMEAELDAVPYLENGQVYIPLRFVAEGLDILVDWDGDNTAVLLTTDSEITPVEAPVAYEEISSEEIPEDLRDWVEENRMLKGIYYKTLGEKTYILISAGEKPTGGYSILLDSITRVAPGSIYLTARVESPDPDMMVIQIITWPHILIAIDDTDVQIVDGLIEDGIKMYEKIDFEVVDGEVLFTNEALAEWVEKNRGIDGIAYTQIDDSIYVYVGVGEKPTGGYSVEIENVLRIKPDEAFVNGVLNSPSPNSTVIQAFTTPYALIRFNQDTIKHVDGEVKQAPVAETIASVGAAIDVEEVTAITLTDLEDNTVKEFVPDEFEFIVDAFNNAVIDDSFYIEMIMGNKMTITLKDGGSVNIISYGSKTNIVASISLPDGTAQSYHLVCPEIAAYLVSIE